MHISDELKCNTITHNMQNVFSGLNLENSEVGSSSRLETK